MGNRGPQPRTGGRPRKPLADKILEGNHGKEPLTVIQLPDSPNLDGVDMPSPHEFLSSEQKSGQDLVASEIYKATWNWLQKHHCEHLVTQQNLEQYAMAAARWIQCEEMTNKLGMLSVHPTTKAPIPSPFINIGINYMNQAMRLWNEIFQIVKENCSTDYDAPTPQTDLMERLLRARENR